MAETQVGVKHNICSWQIFIPIHFQSTLR